MCVKIVSAGHSLLIVLVIIALLASSVSAMFGDLILAHQQLHSIMINQQLWQSLESIARRALTDLTMQRTLPGQVSLSENKVFMPDSLDVNCTTGQIISLATVHAREQPVQLVVTYSVRQ